jgi:hypothetical protein
MSTRASGSGKKVSEKDSNFFETIITNQKGKNTNEKC